MSELKNSPVACDTANLPAATREGGTVACSTGLALEEPANQCFAHFFEIF
jgi:hypothetical protein